jgi:hypothetical protein
MTTTKRSAEEREATRQERLTEAHARLKNGIEALKTSADWTEWLQQAATISKFHRYSFINLMLILAQCPNASIVASATNWRKMKRFPAKGSKALWIYAPMIVKFSPEEIAEDPNRAGQEKLIGWKVVPTFDVSQTAGEPLVANPARPVMLQGETPFEFWAAVVAIAKNNGYSMAIEPLAPEFGEANGLTDFDKKHIQIKPGMSQAQTLKTAVHELAHMFLHHPKNIAEGFTRVRAEVEAESTAFVVLSMLGVVADEYSFNYVANWSDGNTDVVQTTGTTVIKAAGKIIDLFEKEGVKP